MKKTGLGAAQPKHLVPPGVSGKDVSRAVARMPQMPAALRGAGTDGATGAANAPTVFDAPAPSPTVQERDGIFLVEVALLDDSPYQPRRKYNEDTLSELGESLQHAQEEAIVVKPKADGRFELVSGHRRKRAALMWDITHLEARFFRRGDEELAISALITNDAREDLTDYERGMAYVALVEAGKRGEGPIKTFDQLAKRMGKSKSLLSMRVALTKLPPYVTAVLDNAPGAVTVNNVAELKKVLDKAHDPDKLVQNLLRVAAGEISMTALTSIMAAQSGTSANGGNKSHQLISLQAGTRVYAQLVQNNEKRKLTINLPDDGIDVDEVSKIVTEALAAKFGAGTEGSQQ